MSEYDYETIKVILIENIEVLRDVWKHELISKTVVVGGITKSRNLESKLGDIPDLQWTWYVLLDVDQHGLDGKEFDGNRLTNESALWTIEQLFEEPEEYVNFVKDYFDVKGC